MSSIREKIRSAQDRTSRVVDVPEWGVKVEVRSMTGAQRANVVAAFTTEGGGMNHETVWGDMLVTCLHDPDTGDPVFDDGDSEWLLAEKDAAVLDRLSGVCLKVAGIIEGEVDEAGKDSSGSPTPTDE